MGQRPSSPAAHALSTEDRIKQGWVGVPKVGDSCGVLEGDSLGTGTDYATITGPHIDRLRLFFEAYDPRRDANIVYAGGYVIVTGQILAMFNICTGEVTVHRRSDVPDGAYDAETSAWIAAHEPSALGGLAGVHGGDRYIVGPYVPRLAKEVARITAETGAATTLAHHDGLVLILADDKRWVFSLNTGEFIMQPTTAAIEVEKD